jgi:cytochrome c peroxidase
MWAGASPTIASTTSACRARIPGGVRWAGGTPGLPAFKTPSLRELGYTAPYMHDGSRPTLAAVLAHYADTFRKRPSLAPSLRRLHLTGAERGDLIAFLGTLSSAGSPARPKAAGHP